MTDLSVPAGTLPGLCHGTVGNRQIYGIFAGIHTLFCATGQWATGKYMEYLQNSPAMLILWSAPAPFLLVPE
jgi:hypothetical protein